MKIQNISTEAREPKAYAPTRKNIEKTIRMINQSLKYADARAKKTPDDKSLLGKIGTLASNLDQALVEFDSFSR